LCEQEVLRVLARTGGWAAGLQLAALQLRGRADPAAFIERFTGADSHIVNYFGEEVLASQPPKPASSCW
jgi:ATP/maltotriose-dependent transcriptional regulator MalT